MLQSIRENTQGTMAKIIIGIIIVPFALFGIESLLGGGGPQDVAEINGDEVSEYELQRAIVMQKRQMVSRMGENVDESLLEDSKLRQPALDTLIDRQLLLQQADDAEMVISQQTMDKYILQIEDFHADGKFSPGLYEAVLRSSGYTPKNYKALVENELLIKQLASAYIQGGFITPKELEVINKFSHQKRDIRYLTLPMALVESEVETTDVELEDYYQENSARYFTQEKVSIEYLEIKKSDFYQDVEEQDIRSAYDQELASFDPKVERRASHIMIKIDDDTSKADAIQQLNDLKAKIEGGGDFNALAQEFSEDIGTKNVGGDLGYSTGDIFPEAFEEALAELSEGSVSSPVVNDSAVHLLKLTALEKTAAPTFEERRETIKSDLQKADSESDYVAAVETLTDIAFNSEDLQEPADELNLKINRTGLFTRSGDATGIAADKKVARAAFSDVVLSESANSDLLELSDEHVVVLRKLEHKKPELKPFTEVREGIERTIRNTKARDLLALKGQTLLEQLQGGMMVEKLANDNKLEWQAKPASERTGGGINRQILTRAFELPNPGAGKRAVDKLSLSNGDVVILAVSNVKDGAKDDMAEAEAKGMADYLSRLDGQDAFELVQKANRKIADISIY